LILSTTMLMRQKSPPQRALALDILRSATQVKPEAPPPARMPTARMPTATAPTLVPIPTQPAPAPPTEPAHPTASTQPAGERQLIVALPDRAWQLTVDQPGLQVLTDETSRDRRARHVAAVDPATGLNISIFLEPAPFMGDARVARSFFFDRLKRSPLRIADDRFTDMPADIARVDYQLPDARQRHANLYLSREGIWIDVHLSVEDPENQKLPLIDDLARRLRLDPKPPAEK
jgi:hypothetical protein